MFSGVIERDQCHGMDQIKKKTFSFLENDDLNCFVKSFSVNGRW